MKMIKIDKSQFHTTEWSGGKTTQLYIWPEDSDYQNRSFKVRISSATVDQEESVFSQLNGIQRFLAVLTGKIELQINQDVTVNLSPYQIIEFDGGAKTVSRGKCRDFNLMLNGVEGELSVISVDKEAIRKVSENNWYFLYCEAPCFVSDATEHQILIHQDGLMIRDVSVEETIRITTTQQTSLLVVTIKC